MVGQIKRETLLKPVQNPFKKTHKNHVKSHKTYMLDKVEKVPFSTHGDLITTPLLYSKVLM